MHYLKKSFIIKAFSFAVLLMSATPIFSQTFKVNGNAVDHNNGLIRLTSSATAGVQKASAWNTTKIDLTQPFDKSFDLFFGCIKDELPIDKGGDGITFTFQNDPRGLNAIGEPYGWLGIGPPGPTALKPAISIEFDTWNAGPPADIPADHIAVDINGDVNAPQPFSGTVGGITTTKTVQPVLGGRDLENCAAGSGDFYRIRIVWTPSDNTLKLYEDGTLTMTYTNNLVANVFGGNSQVYWGFTAATGDASNEQWVAPAGTIIPWECSTNSCCMDVNIQTPTNPTTICNNPITIAVDNVYEKYDWSTGATTPTAQITEPGTYTVTVLQDQSGHLCPGTETFTITPTGPTATLSGGTTLCNNTLTTALPVALTGIAPYKLTYAIDGVAQPTITGITPPFSIQGKGPHTYTLVTIEDNSGCSGIGTGSATIDLFPGIPVGIDNSFIAPGSTTLSVINQGGTYKWYDTPTGTNLVGTGVTFTTPILNATTTYYVENIDATKNLTASVGLLDKSEGNGPDPNDKSFGLPENTLGLKFTANSNFKFTQFTCMVNVVGPWENSILHLTIKDEAGGTWTKDSLFTTPLAPGINNIIMPLNVPISVGHNYIISYVGENSSGLLGGSIQGIVYWQLNHYPVTKDPEITLTASTDGSRPTTAYPGIFDWKISVPNPAANCGRTPVTAYVSTCPTGKLSVSGSDVICDDGIKTAKLQVVFTGTSPWTFIYAIDGVAQTPITTTSSPYLFDSKPGAHTYTLTSVTNALETGCTGNAIGTAKITVNPAPPSANDGTFISPGTAELTINNPDATTVYNWYAQPTGGSPLFTGPVFTTPELTSTTTYYVDQTVTSVTSCSRTPVKATIVLPEVGVIKIQIPNLITPNGDKKNDQFEIQGLPDSTGNKLVIYNRWGSSVFQTDNYDNKWDGGNVPAGLYFYELHIKDGKKYSGWLQITR